MWSSLLINSLKRFAPVIAMFAVSLVEKDELFCLVRGRYSRFSKEEACLIS